MKPKTKHIIREYAESIIIAVVLALFVRAFIVQAFKIPTGSMRPTFMERDRIFVNKFIYRFTKPKRADIIVFKYPEDMKKDFIKRVVGTEGEVVEISDGNVLINGRPVKEPDTIASIYYYNRGEFAEKNTKLTVPKDSYFVLGDNSASSRDSRYWGFVPKKNLIGKAMVIYWPIKRIGRVR